MRNIIFIAIFLLVAVGFTSESFTAPKPDTVPNQLGTIKCGQTVTIYQQYSNRDNSVTVTVSDFCTGSDSRLTGIFQSPTTPIDVTIPDGNTITASFDIRTQIVGGKIELECLGDSGEGFCIYKIEDIRLVP